MQLAINNNKTLIEFEVTFSKRKTLAIIISPTGNVRVAAFEPYKAELEFPFVGLPIGKAI